MTGETALRLCLAVCGSYLVGVGVAALLFAGPLTLWLGSGTHTSCYPWVQLIGPMAVPLGVATILCAHDLRGSMPLERALLVLGASQVPLDAFFIVTAVFPWQKIGIDAFVLSATAGMVLLNRRYLRPTGCAVNDRRPHAPHKPLPWHLRLTLTILPLYLVVGWFWAVFLPSKMNQLLGYSLSSVCIPWVQLTGPLALALSVPFIMAVREPKQYRALILCLGVGGCTLEIMLDCFFLWTGSFKAWQLSLDLVVSAFCGFSLLFSVPYLFERLPTTQAQPPQPSI